MFGMRGMAALDRLISDSTFFVARVCWRITLNGIDAHARVSHVIARPRQGADGLRRATIGVVPDTEPRRRMCCLHTVRVRLVRGGTGAPAAQRRTLHDCADMSYSSRNHISRCQFHARPGLPARQVARGAQRIARPHGARWGWSAPQLPCWVRRVSHVNLKFLDVIADDR